MTPKRPYLLRGLYEWIVDNDLTPHLVVDATIVGTVVPQNFVSEGQIVLNISPTAVQNLQLADHEVRFNARFGGQPMQVVVPMTAALAIYARENGAGAMFEAEPELDKMPGLDEEEQSNTETEQKSAKKKPNLKVVK
ncbi:ClpXP protease specificity-enhancing factor [Idiomarina abyssalis]|uniref:ClpXP protease specificity-enhancing factor n=1 Tax=Idiomarina abyssalis TaxID=86102 RepID=A0A8I1G9S5_9GAMM|nr:ClpXP protease specificity-enhancing factor [Idiomarina abyssalis]MBJ7266608.1 ClpXP protease specificity-enhancing factor [Idiomarina abyssalis]MBJ7273166.1 ClpXP protease specificity-enhancing factor [Idiomarina abyssalis]MBJ7315779.1 ClpXP protease specificity-enhancing factor [Idiomarina abyssalis]MDA6067049.1 ClpXP protease specificity-enhancing factor [Idiomarina abyssalis]